MEDYEQHQIHDENIAKLLKESGCMDSKGRIRSWKGKQTLDLLLQNGHNSLDYTKCKCRISKSC